MNGEHKLTSLKNLETGTIKIGASTTVTKYFLLPFVEKFHEKYPNIDISITNHLTTTLVSMLKKGSLDVLIVNLPMEKDSDLEIMPCYELHDCFATNSKYKEQIKKKISLQELVENYPIVTQKEPSNTRTFLNQIMKKHEINFHPKFDIVSYSLVKDFAKIGMGVSYITKEFAKEELEKGELIEIPIKEKIPTRGLGIVLPKNTITSFATQEFIDIIKSSTTRTPGTSVKCPRKEEKMFEELKAKIEKCDFCKEKFGFDPHPVFWGKQNSKIVQISQAPSKNVHKSLKPFTDMSGKTLKYEWYQISDEHFYNTNNFFIGALAHCYPGKDNNGNDRQPPKCCFTKWVEKELKILDNQIYIIIGAKAAKTFFPNEKFDELVFKDNYWNGKLTLVIPHPSPLNKKWIKDHPEFLEKRIVEIREIINKEINRRD